MEATIRLGSLSCNLAVECRDWVHVLQHPSDCVSILTTLFSLMLNCVGFSSAGWSDFSHGPSVSIYLTCPSPSCLAGFFIIPMCYILLSIVYSSILHYTILYCTILYYTILYDTILYYTLLYYTLLYYTILYYTKLYYTILYYTILYFTILYKNTILYYTRLD